MVRSLDDDGVDLITHFVKHVLVREKTPRRREVRPVLGAARLGDELLEDVESRRIRIDDSDEILAENAVYHRLRLESASDQRDPNLRAFRDLPRSAHAESGDAFDRR